MRWRRFPALAAFADRFARHVRAWIAVWAAVGGAAALALSLGPLEGIPHVQDEVVYELQARLLSEGRLWEAPRLPRAAHHYEFVINDDQRRYGVFPNGWPAILAIGKWLGASYAINPILHALTVALGAVFAGRLLGRRAAFLAAPLLALSPGLVVLAASRMSHTLAALLLLAAAFLVFTTPASRRTAFLCGSALGWLALTRPLDGLLATLALAAVVVVRGEYRHYVAALPPLVAALGILLLQNLILEGHPLTFPQTSWFARAEPAAMGKGLRYTATCNGLGFGEGHGCFAINGSIDHSVARGLSFVKLNLELTGRLWFGFWPIGLLALMGLTTRRIRALTITALGLWVAAALAYSTYWYHGACYGPRFHHGVAPLITLTLALGLTTLTRLSGILSVLALLPLLAFGQRFTSLIPELRGYWGVDGRLNGMDQRWDRGPSLILVAYGGQRPHTWRLLPNTSEPILGYVATLRRGMWIERSSKLLQFAEYHPALHGELVRRAEGRRVFLLMLHATRALDYLVPLEALPPPLAPQTTSLPLPAKLPYYPTAFTGGEPAQRYYDLD